MLFVQVTEHLTRVVDRVLREYPGTSMPKQLRNECAVYVNQPQRGTEESDVVAIPVEVVKQLSAFLKGVGDADAPLHRLMQGTRIVFDPKPAAKKPSVMIIIRDFIFKILYLLQPPELEERRERMRNELANQEYRRLVANILPEEERTGYSLHDDVREFRNEYKQVTAILNMLFSIAGVFAAVYVASGAGVSSVQIRITLALAAALITAIAEAWMFMRHSNIADPAQTPAAAVGAAAAGRRQPRRSRAATAEVPSPTAESIPLLAL